MRPHPANVASRADAALLCINPRRFQASWQPARVRRTGIRFFRCLRQRAAAFSGTWGAANLTALHPSLSVALMNRKTFPHDIAAPAAACFQPREVRA
jgi:hypothetical protein